MLIKNILLPIIKKAKELFELILVTILIFVILVIPDFFLFMGDLNQYAGIRLLLTDIVGGVIAYFGYLFKRYRFSIRYFFR
ncbi:putative integral membrane protein [Leuconostoc rapi]|nr:putative integral membrane protein [Leuconostoc rapi]